VPARLLLGTIVTTVLIAARAAAPSGATAGSDPSTLLAVRSASLQQNGLQLVWTVELSHRWSAPGLVHVHGSLCLLLEPRRGASHSLCVAPGRHGIVLLYGPRRPPRRIAAAISRSNPEQMTARFLPSAIGLGYTPVRWQVAAGAGIMTSEYPARPALAKLHAPKLVGCQPSGPSLVYGGPASAHEIALTFDDGPWWQPPSMMFVKLLASYHVPATFFEIGRQIPQYDPTGAIERAMLADDDMIGDHTWSHPDMAALPPAAQRSQLELTVQAIRHATRGFSPCLWRAPGGAISGALVVLARSLGMLTIMWNIDPRDWALPGVGSIEGNVLTNARNGGIVEMHFGGGPRYETFDSLPTIIRSLRARGYRFVNLAQMLGLRLIYK
jgi:peptidoglycan/xylan/chitin deacetylase (PgdA/CDA1 family)